MRLRKLEEKDAPLMLEWMHDPDVVENLNKNFAAMTMDDCKRFIIGSADTKVNLHLAIVDDNDEYMGTVSLKDIHREAGDAEFGITVRAAAMGRGFSSFAMKEMIRIGLEEEKLQKIYWCVDASNGRALHFYDKNGYKRVRYEELGVQADYTEEQIRDFVWYLVEAELA